MDSALINMDAITLFVADRDRAKAFYVNVLDLQPVFEDESSVAFRLKNIIVNLLIVPEAVYLIAPGRVGAQDAGARFQLTVGVENVDAVAAELGRRGVSLLNGPMDRPWGIRTACFADPDGHIWEIAHPLT